MAGQKGKSAGRDVRDARHARDEYEQGEHEALVYAFTNLMRMAGQGLPPRVLAKAAESAAADMRAWAEQKETEA